MEDCIGSAADKPEPDHQYRSEFNDAAIARCCGILHRAEVFAEVVMSTSDRNLILALLLLWWFSRNKAQESTSVNFPNENVLKECPGGWVVDYNAPCPPTT